MQINRPIAVLVIAVVCAAAPATSDAQNREHQQMAAELRILQEQNQLLSIALQQAMGKLTEAVTSITARLDASDDDARRSLADQKLLLDGLATELRVIRERTQDSSTRIGTLSEEVRAMQSSIAALAALATAAPPRVYDPFTGLTAEPQAADRQAPAPGPGVSTLGISPSRLYQEAWTDYTAGLFDLAIDGFQAYLREFPTYEQADDAQLLIGDSYRAQGKHQEAITAYRAVIQNYPSGDKVPEAYLSLGQAQRALGQIDAARDAWETVIRLFKDSNSAIIARQRLEGLP